MNLLKNTIRYLDDEIISVADLYHLPREVLSLGTDLRGNGGCVAFPNTNLFLLSFPFVCVCDGRGEGERMERRQEMYGEKGKDERKRG